MKTFKISAALVVGFVLAVPMAYLGISFLCWMIQQGIYLESQHTASISVHPPFWDKLVLSILISVGCAICSLMDLQEEKALRRNQHQ